MGINTSAIEYIREAGEEISWEIIGCESRWYVTASNNPESDDGFEFSVSGKSLTACIRRVYDEIQKLGPPWSK